MRFRLFLISLLILASNQIHGAMLYDSGAGTDPSSQGWISYLEGGSFGINSGAFTMNTTVDNGIRAFYGRADQALDTFGGYTLELDLRIDSEDHTRENRAGFSFIAVGQDVTKSLEVAFWEDSIWVYEYDGGNFSKGAEFLVDTTVRRNYRLQVQNHEFSLLVDNTPGINGMLEDYSPFGFPYNVSNALIFGDNTRSGGSSVEIFSIQTVPIPPALILFMAGLGMFGYTAGRRKPAY